MEVEYKNLVPINLSLTETFECNAVAQAESTNMLPSSIYLLLNANFDSDDDLPLTTLLGPGWISPSCWQQWWCSYYNHSRQEKCTYQWEWGQWWSNCNHGDTNMQAKLPVKEEDACHQRRWQTWSHPWPNRRKDRLLLVKKATKKNDNPKERGWWKDIPNSCRPSKPIKKKLMIMLSIQPKCVWNF
jgi:hypothetical protein